MLRGMLLEYIIALLSLLGLTMLVTVVLGFIAVGVEGSDLTDFKKERLHLVNASAGLVIYSGVVIGAFYLLCKALYISI